VSHASLLRLHRSKQQLKWRLRPQNDWGSCLFEMTGAAAFKITEAAV